MNPRSRKVAVFVGAAALAGAAGIGVAAGGDSTGPSAATSRSAPGPAGGGGPRGFDVSALAERLGVSEGRLQEALETIRPRADGSGAAPSGPPPDGADGSGATPAEPPKDSLPGGGDGSGAMPGEPPRSAGGSALAEALAEELGLPVDDVEAALEAEMPSGASPDRGAAPNADESLS